MTPARVNRGDFTVAVLNGTTITNLARGAANKIADAGYVVLVPDLFYRYGPYGPFVPRDVLAAGFRAILGPLMATTDPIKAADDTGAVLAYLDEAGREAGSVGAVLRGHGALRSVNPRRESHEVRDPGLRLADPA